MGEALEIGVTLLAIATLEGVRKARGSFIILQFVAFRGWRFGGAIPLGHEYLLTSPLLPIAAPIILDRDQSALDSRLSNKRLLKRCQARVRRAHDGLRVLQATGVVGLALLVVYLPIASAQRGSFGLLNALAAVFVLASAQILLTSHFLRRLGLSRAEGFRRAARLLNPFAIGRAAEIVAARLVEGVPAIGALVVLLGRSESVRQLRPVFYDLVHGGGDLAEREILEVMAPMSEWRALLLHTLDVEGVATCPRCGSQFEASMVECSDCDAIGLIGVRDSTISKSPLANE